MDLPKWQPPRHWRSFTSVDAHAAGEPLRVITGGVGDIPGETMLEKRHYASQNLDHIRRVLMWEPRGHADMYGCIPTPAVTPDGDVGLLFLHNDGFSTMCGHGVIAFVTVALECGLLEARAGSEIRLDTPAGRVTAWAEYRGSRVSRITLRNVPSFVLHHRLDLEIPSLGQVSCQVAYGGAFYAYVDARQISLSLTKPESKKIIEAGRAIKAAVQQSSEVRHPTADPDLNFLYGTIFVGEAQSEAQSRQVCVFADGEVDRSPTGTGVSGRAALLYARGKLKLGEAIEIESILGTRFKVKIAELCRVGELEAVIPEVSGAAFISGRHEWLIDPEDPLSEGFLLR